MLVAIAMLVRTDLTALSTAWIHLAVASVLVNAFYLTGVYLVLDHINAATMTLIGALHPILTALLARHLLGERLSYVQWIGPGLAYAALSWSSVSR